jgi:hypothetical protein
MRWAALLLCCGCAVGRWESVRAEKPATRAELAAWPVSAADPLLREALAEAGFAAVARPPYKGELELSREGDLFILRSDGFFVDEVRGAPREAVEALAASRRVAEFVRNSGLPQQRDLPIQ